MRLARAVERIKLVKIKSEKYVFTRHSLYKIKYYGLSESRVKRIIRYPARTEEAIIPGMIAAMKPAGLATEALAKAVGKKYSEIWTMYKHSQKSKNIKIITAWRYPGKSPIHNPIPKEILEEVRSII